MSTLLSRIYISQRPRKRRAPESDNCQDTHVITNLAAIIMLANTDVRVLITARKENTTLGLL